LTRSQEGVILGAIILTIIPEKFRVFAEYRMLFYGVIIITVLVFRPEGFIPKRIRQYTSLAYGKGK
jgi:ABC-type branched-chain amino acid transport system, permease component